MAAAFLMVGGDVHRSKQHQGGEQAQSEAGGELHDAAEVMYRGILQCRSAPASSMQILILGSGSSGNCALIQAGQGDDRVVVCLDCGLPQRTGRGLAEAAGWSLTAVDAVLLTHHHADHCLNVVGVAARAQAPLFAAPAALAGHPALAESERRRRGLELRPYASGQPFEIGPLRCRPVRLSHDAEPTHGFVFEADGRRLGFFTDLGVTDALSDEVLDGVDTLVLEFNHDLELLRRGPYPPQLQQRVAGDRGHLSNAQSAELLAARTPRPLRTLVLAHLSQKNNTPALAGAAAAAGLARAGAAATVRIAPPRGPLSI